MPCCGACFSEVGSGSGSGFSIRSDPYPGEPSRKRIPAPHSTVYATAICKLNIAGIDSRKSIM